jgi:5'-methylthioadenosine phosphorylase
MSRLAVILGSGTAGAAQDFAGATGDGVFTLPRHGADGHTLPHLLDHAANLRAVEEAGCDRVLAISSVGSLKEEIRVGAAVCPDDFIALQMSPSPFDDWRGHMTPGFDLGWRAEVVAAWRGVAGEPYDGGVYWQTTGPRFETPAEIRMMAAHAEVVGMTVASECVVAGELGIPYAAVCIVDNMANGIGSTLDVEELAENRIANAERLRAAIAAVAAELAG